MNDRGYVPPMIRSDQSGAYISEPFTYQVTFEALTGLNPTATGNIQIQADAEFAIIQTTYQFIQTTQPWTLAVQLAAPPPFQAKAEPNLSVLITDTGSGRQFSNQPVPVISNFGDAKLPYIWPVPRLIAASAVLNFQVVPGAVGVDFGADVWMLQLSFHGEKRYRKTK
jgi:hypothetical protein